MSGLPRISVVTPSYQQAQYLGATLESVRTQEYPHLEHCVVDGGSTDGSVDVIRGHAGQLSWWVSEKDRGQSDAINKGFARTTGEVVCWLNSDDLFEPRALWTVGEAFASDPRMQFFAGGASWLSPDGSCAPVTASAATFADLLRYMAGVYLPQPAVFFRRSLLQKVGPISGDLHYGMDLDLWLRMGLAIGPDVPIPRTSRALAKLRVHDDQKTLRDNARAMLEISGIVERYLQPYGRTRHFADPVWKGLVNARALSLLKLEGIDVYARHDRSYGNLVRAVRVWIKGCPEYLMSRHFAMFAARCLVRR